MRWFLLVFQARCHSETILIQRNIFVVIVTISCRFFWWIPSIGLLSLNLITLNILLDKCWEIGSVVSTPENFSLIGLLGGIICYRKTSSVLAETLANRISMLGLAVKRHPIKLVVVKSVVWNVVSRLPQVVVPDIHSRGFRLKLIPQRK